MMMMMIPGVMKTGLANILQLLLTQSNSSLLNGLRFIWLNGSITLILAETERYDIVRFSNVTTKSLASATGFLIGVK